MKRTGIYITTKQLRSKQQKLELDQASEVVTCCDFSRILYQLVDGVKGKTGM
jgi:hypothetical protein